MGILCHKYENKEFQPQVKSHICVINFIADSFLALSSVLTEAQVVQYFSHPGNHSEVLKMDISWLSVRAADCNAYKSMT